MRSQDNPFAPPDENAVELVVWSGWAKKGGMGIMGDGKLLAARKEEAQDAARVELTASSSPSTEPLLTEQPAKGQQRMLRSFGKAMLLHVASVALSLFNMLLVMTMNVGVFVTVVAGLSVGHMLFTWSRHRRRLGRQPQLCHP